MTLTWMALIAASVGIAAATYAMYVGIAWCRYGHAVPATAAERDALLDRLLPEYEVAERHHVRVAAPANITLSAAKETDLEQSGIVRAIFRTRELMLGAKPPSVTRPKGLFAQMRSLGWGVLAEDPGREIVAGATTQPWLANVVFRALLPDQFGAFREPGYVKIVWTLRADAVGPNASVFRTETRVATTDATARRRFRWYWARFSPGIILIRYFMLWNVKREAEHRAHVRSSGPPQSNASDAAPANEINASAPPAIR
jgi:hypothetical protein